MKVFLDTSVLVAASVKGHVHHERAAWWFKKPEGVTLCAAWHAIAECWSALTCMPHDPPLSPSIVRQVVTRLESHLVLAPQSGRVYREAIRRCSERGLRSGVIYDALHLVTATSVGADLILTFNVADFIRIREDGDPLLIVPPDPPSFPKLPTRNKPKK